ncbi:TIGR04338 family metallohydrolase [Nocardia sp. BSTN01]|uniref:TIGR04338 family metallohydrolase n=1 Tax=Nocardia sp. BSTN01 TaxID=2783665 RepID=UPI00188F3A8C|nr:TIGR04338 family metallohydrolase [Nocardia sp. BSTN01]MBF4999144.1 TIGR04338 family metallohydrolase [Nocardia sp. BSTN01]
MTARPRDSQRRKVYDAEHRLRALFDLADRTPGRTVELFGSHICVPVERRMGTVESVTAYLAAVMALPSIRARYPRAAAAVRVRARRGSRYAHYEPATATIAVPLREHAVRELLVLHELAHHLQPRPAAGHGPEFCRVFCEVLDTVVGAEAGWLMRTLLHDTGAHLT